VVSMCEFVKRKSSNPRIDKCMLECICTLDAMSHNSNIKVVACCCSHGHKDYPMTIVVENREGAHWELLSGTTIPRRRNFYKRDKDGYYYIPEVIDNAA